MFLTQLQLKSKIKQLPENKRRKFLLNCIEKNKLLDKFIKETIKQTEDKLKLSEDTVELSEEDLKKLGLLKEKSLNEQEFCRICNRYEFVRDKYTETCQNCGYQRDIQSTGKVYEKIEYIKPGANIVKITKDSKEIKVDLNKINQWLQETDPMANDTKKIIDNLEIIFQGKSIELPKHYQNKCV